MATRILPFVPAAICNPGRLWNIQGAAVAANAQFGETSSTLQKGKRAGPGPWASYSVGFPSAVRHHCLLKTEFVVRHLTSFYLARESRSLSLPLSHIVLLLDFGWPENFLLLSGS
jgi:hypothetical protein